MRENLNKGFPVVISVGSNLGHREENVLKAVDAVCGIDGICGMITSSLYETEPVSGHYSGTFINLASFFRTAIAPARVLALLQGIEAGIAGTVDSRGRDRVLDIDLILYDSVMIRSENLVIPHPRFSKRAFVVEPMLEICPWITIPPSGVRLSEHINRESLHGWTRVISSRYSLSLG